VRSRRYTRGILQAAADQWAAVIRTYDYKMPAERIIVYTSGIEFESAITEPLLAPGGPVWGRAARSKGGTPIVYVKIGLPRRTIGYDPLRTLIHELLHHVRPVLEHEFVYELAQDFREIEKTVRPTQAPNVEDGLEELDASREPAPPLRRAAREQREQRLLEAVDTLWLDANGFPPEGPQRSELTGRFIKPTRFPDDPEGTTSVKPRRGPRGFSYATRSVLVREDTNELPDKENMMPKLAKKNATTKKPAAKMAAKAPAKIPAKKAPAKAPAKTSDPKTGDEKRIERNASLRAYRKANRDKVNEYNRAWHAARKAATQKDESTTKAVELDQQVSKPSAVGGEKSES